MMDERVNCMTCLVANEEWVLENAVATVGIITHALARVVRPGNIAHHLCAFDAAGVMKGGRYWESRVEEENIIGLAKGS